MAHVADEETHSILWLPCRSGGLCSEALEESLQGAGVAHCLSAGGAVSRAALPDPYATKGVPWN